MDLLWTCHGGDGRLNHEKKKEKSTTSSQSVAAGSEEPMHEMLRHRIERARQTMG